MKTYVLFAALMTMLLSGLAAQPVMVIEEDFEGVPLPSWGSVPIHDAAGLNLPRGGWTTMDPFLPARPHAAVAGRPWRVQDKPTAWNLGPDPAPAVNQTRWVEYGWYPFVTNYSVAAVTPALDLTAADASASCFALTFTLHNDGMSPYAWAHEFFEVWLIDDDAASPQWVQAFTRMQQFGMAAAGHSVTTTEHILIPFNTSSLRIALVAQGNGSGDMDCWMVDNMQLRAVADAMVYVSRDGKPVQSGGLDGVRFSTPFAPQTTRSVEWQVANMSGHTALDLSSVHVSGQQNCSVQVLAHPASISAGGTATVEVQVTPQQHGPYTFRLHIDNNDANVWFDISGHAAIPGGTYTVGAGGQYADIGEAFDALEDCGILGAVTMEVATGTYAADTRYMLGLNEAYNLKGILAPVRGVSAQNPITIKAAAGATPVITGSFYTEYYYMARAQPALAISCPHVTIEGLTITNATYAGIHVGSANFSWWSGNPEHDSPADNVTIRACRIHNVVNGMAIATTGVYATINDLLIENCAIWNCGTCNFPNFAPFNSQGLITLYNLGTGCRVLHNTLVQNNGKLVHPIGYPHNHNVAAIGGSYGQLAEMSNNILISTINNGTLLAFEIGSSPAVCENNLMFTTQNINFALDPWYPDFAAWQAAGFDVNGLWADPHLESLALNADVHLMAHSPARNAAVASAVTTDFEGDQRPQAGTPDIGCDEYRAPQLVVSQGGAGITHGSNLNLGDVPQSGLDFTFDIFNTGIGPLFVNAVSAPTVSAGSSVWVTTTPAAIVQPGTGSSFTVNVAPQIGAFTFELHIDSDDLSASPFVIYCDGNGLAVAPQVSVTEGGATVAHGATAAGGRLFVDRDVNAGPSAYTWINVSNTGTADMVLTLPTLGGANASDFVLDVSSLLVSLAPGESSSFGVAFDPAAKGIKSATVNLGHNDPSTPSPFTFEVRGTGLDAAGVTLTTAALPDSTVEALYAFQFIAAGGTAPYTFTLVSNSLPAGFSLASDGSLSGNPMVEGNFGCTVRVTDALGGTDERPFTLRVNANMTLAPGGGGGSGGCSAAAGGAGWLLLVGLLAATVRRRKRA